MCGLRHVNPVFIVIIFFFSLVVFFKRKFVFINEIISLMFILSQRNRLAGFINFLNIFEVIIRHYIISNFFLKFTFTFTFSFFRHFPDISVPAISKVVVCLQNVIME